MRSAIGTSLLVLVSGTACFHQPSAQHGNPSDTEVVRATRSRFNDAIGRHDAAGIEGFLLPNYHIVTGRSAQTQGRSAAIQDWRTIFSGDSTVIYVRTPDKMLVNAARGVAEDLGTRAGHFTASYGVLLLSGVYSANWQRDANRPLWLHAKLFTQTTGPGGPRAWWTPARGGGSR